MRVYLTKHAARELRKIPDSIAKTIDTHLQNLSNTPYPPNSKKLHGIGDYRLRIGSFRVIYSIDTKRKEITVLRVADRRTIYRKMV